MFVFRRQFLAKTVGVEIPNRVTSMVTVREILESVPKVIKIVNY